jgi:hypothetical protein
LLRRRGAAVRRASRDTPVEEVYAARVAASATSRIKMIAAGGAISSCFFVVTPTTFHRAELVELRLDVLPGIDDPAAPHR